MATCVGAGHAALDGRYYDLVLVDECTQATEPSNLIPIVKCKNNLVLIGDHCQLPPTITSNKLKRSGLSISLFERLLDIYNPANPANPLLPHSAPSDDSFSSPMGLAASQLMTQYRMHPLISYFYKGVLRDGVTAEQRVPPAGFPWPQQQPLAFLPCYTPEDQQVGSSKTKWAKAAMMADVVDALLAGGSESGLRAEEIGVVTGYMGQVRLIRDVFAHRGGPACRSVDVEKGDLGLMMAGGVYKDLEIMSVDGYQGWEKDVIIFSCVRSNPHGAVGFLGTKDVSTWPSHARARA
jgi:regulator of nonsense transcripts 1